MAIDTAQKRFSMMGFGCPVPQSVTVPSGSVDAAARADLLYLYSGIAITAPVTVPSIVGLTESAADSALIAEGLVSGTVTYARSRTVAEGLVISQDPAAGASAPSGSSVDYVVSLGFPLGGGGGAKKYAKRKYPRRVIVNGRTYWVKTPQEERALLELLLAKEREQLVEAQEQEKPAPVVAKRKTVIRRIETRLEKVDDAAAAWRQQLDDWDEELIALLMH